MKNFWLVLILIAPFIVTCGKDSTKKTEIHKSTCMYATNDSPVIQCGSVSVKLGGRKIPDAALAELKSSLSTSMNENCSPNNIEPDTFNTTAVTTQYSETASCPKDYLKRCEAAQQQKENGVSILMNATLYYYAGASENGYSAEEFAVDCAEGNGKLK